MILSDADRPESGGAAPTLPAIGLPKGGGAIRGLGEAFTANPATGTGSCSVPIALSPGRSGFGPTLVLGYDSGRGNGPFGLGWDLGLPTITRRTERMLPTYRDEAESDVFVLSAAEDLVPERDATGNRVTLLHPAHAPGHRIDRYRPRVEAGFARIERWTRTADGDTHWRTISGANVTSVFGADPTARITDPADPRRVFSWLISSSHDDRGNAVRYEYQADDDAGVNLGAPGERNRTSAVRATNRYLKRIRYGNRVSRLVDPALTAPDWAYEVVIDYGEHDDAAPTPAGTRPWTCRLDPFSSYRAGFEIRTQRLARRVLVFHHFPDEPDVGAACLVGATELRYGGDPHRGDNVVSLLTAVTKTGYRRAADGYRSRSAPSLELDYQQGSPTGEVRDLEQATLAGLPGPAGHWVDLDGDGLAGVLTEQAAHWLYQRNLGDGRFAPPRPLPTVPATRQLGSGRQLLLDLDGAGRLDCVTLDGPAPGSHERTDDGDWAPFTPLAARPVVDLGDPYVRWLDLDGDGRTDILITEADALTWYPSLGRDGFGPARRIPTGTDEERGPQPVSADGTDSLHLADMSGDGLTDLVRVRNGEVCYWPNLGHGRFGAKVTMAGAPRFATAEGFDPALVRLADVDGSGTTDLLYLGGGVRIWPNQAGNGFGPPWDVESFPAVDDHSAVTVVDLLGSGTACLVWSSPLPGAVGRQVRYLDLTGGVKPHLLAGYRNNLGAETRIGYGTSTTSFLADRAAGRPWATRLPFPVHVVTQVETIDHVSRNRFVSRYAYHHGHYDGAEREFRGFGMVEQTDTEAVGTLSDSGTSSPPVLTRTWFHTGWFDPAGRISRHFADEYWAGDPGMQLPDTVLPDGLSAAEAREACRALRGLALRTEVYALDGTAAEPLPYAVTEQNAAVRLLQPRSATYAVVFPHPRESVTLHYERQAVPDPRLAHTVTLDVDAFGNVLRSASIAYGRRQPDTTLSPASRAVQARLLATVTDDRYTEPVATAEDHRTPLPAEHRTFELLGLAQPAGRLLTVPEIAAAAAAARDVPPEDLDAATAPPGQPARRLLAHDRVRYRSDDLTGALPLGRSGVRALPFETYRLALTGGIVAAAYGDRVTDAMLVEAGYVREADGTWWVPSGRVFHAATEVPAAEELAQARQHFFLPARHRDPFGAITTVAHDRYDLLPVLGVDAVGNRTEVECDYRVLAPRRVTDPNGNHTEVAFDLLGAVVGTARTGKAGEQVGDTLAGFVPDLTDAQIEADLADPLAAPHALLAGASTRMIHDLFAYRRSRDQDQPQGPVVHTMARETHAADLAPGEASRIRHDLAYCDGFSRVVQSKAQAQTGPDGGPRWIGSGWTVFNTKGSPVRRYEPFFSATHRFESGRAVGVSPVLCYDPVQRVVATLRPDHSWSKVVFDPWRQEMWDGNDAVLLDPTADPQLRPFATRLPAADHQPTWHAARIGGALGAAERDAATKAAAHAATPAVAHLDPLGRPFLTVAHNRDPLTLAEEHAADRVRLDVEGRTREVTDALSRPVVRNIHAMGSATLRTSGIDTGERRVLPDIAGTPLYRWDDRGHRHRTLVDPLRRPTRLLLRVGPSAEIMVGRTVYGEDLPDAAARNLRTVAYQTFDAAGVLTIERRDFKGNVLAANRRFAQPYRAAIDWAAAPDLEAEAYATSTRYDALDRPVQVVAPHAGTVADVLRRGYDASGALDRIDVWSRRPPPADLLDPATADLHAVTAVDHDARGRRTRVGTATARSPPTYDPVTSRLSASSPPGARDGAGPALHLRPRRQHPPPWPTPPCRRRSSPTKSSIPVRGTPTTRSTGWSRPPSEHLAARRPADRRRAHVALTTSRRRCRNGRYTERTATTSWQHPRAGAPGARGRARRGPGGTTTPSRAVLVPARSATALHHRVGDGPVATYGYDEHGNTLVMPHLPLLAWGPQPIRRARSPPGGRAVPRRPPTTSTTRGERVRASPNAPARPRPGRVSAATWAASRTREYAGDGRTVVLERETLLVADGAQRIALVNPHARHRPGAARLVRSTIGNHLGSAALSSTRPPRSSPTRVPPLRQHLLQAVRSQTETPKRYRYTARSATARPVLLPRRALLRPLAGPVDAPDPPARRRRTSTATPQRPDRASPTPPARSPVHRHGRWHEPPPPPVPDSPAGAFEAGQRAGRSSAVGWRDQHKFAEMTENRGGCRSGAG
jgi:hypothetical protein